MLSKDNFASKAIKYILYSIINILAYIPMLCAFKYNQTLIHPITIRGASNITPVSHPQLAMPPWAGPRGSLALLESYWIHNRKNSLWFVSCLQNKDLTQVVKIDFGHNANLSVISYIKLGDHETILLRYKWVVFQTPS